MNGNARGAQGLPRGSGGTFPRLGSSHQGGGGHRHGGHHSRWHIPTFKDYQPPYTQGSSNDRDKDMFGFPKPPGGGGPSPSSFPMEPGPDVRQLPPLLLPQRSVPPQVADNPVPMLNGPMINLNLNPGLLAPIENTEFQQRPPASIQPEIRHNPVPPSASPFFRPPNAQQDDGRKEMLAQSESPSRKRRRIVGSQAQNQNTVPPLPAHHQPVWEPRRNLRQPPRNNVPVRRPQRYPREWPQENHAIPRIQHPPAFPPPHPSTSHHQPPLMMDLGQVPVSLPLPLYSSGPTPGAHLSPCQVHSIYCTTSPQHTCQLNSFGGCMSHHSTSHHHHHHHTTGSVLFPSVTHVHYSAHLAPRHDPIEIDIIMDPHHHRPPPPPTHHPTILQVPTPSSIFISEVPRRTSGRARWSRPIQPPPSPFPGWLHILAMFSNPPLSPYGQDVGETHHTPENYEEFLNIADRLGDAKPRGLNKAEIDQLPSFKYSCEGGEGDKTSCVICLCDFESRQTLRGLPCSHQFHAKCIDKWLKSNPTCPICRGDASGYIVRTE